MRVAVKVSVASKNPAVAWEETLLGEKVLVVRVAELPVEGAANRAVVAAVAAFFGVRKSGVKIVRGEKSSKKLLEVGE